MSDLGLRNGTVSNVANIKEQTDMSDTAVAARELLKNGILVETNKGLVCMSLSDALNHGVGGHCLSEEDFQNVATELLFQEPNHLIVSDNSNIPTDSLLKQKKKQLKRNIGSIQSKPAVLQLESSEQVENDGEVHLSLDSLGYPPVMISDIDILNHSVFQDNLRSLSGLTTSTDKPVASRRVPNTCSLLKASEVKTVIPTPDVESLVVGQHLGPVLINDVSGSVSGEDWETSDNSEATQASTSTCGEKPKKRGGWPKGRKRKPESEIRPPKAPATGYVLFLNEKRKDYKDMPFTEVTKLLGSEWSKLGLSEKRIYLEQAEIEKKRYREELKMYRQSDAYQVYLQWKRLKKLQGNGTEESDMDATDEIDEEDNEELYCRSCDQWFHSLHNKKEHLYGRQHLQTIAGRRELDWTNAHMSSTSLDESSLDGSSYLVCKKTDTGDSLHMDDAIVRLMAANKDREDERKFLRAKLEEGKTRSILLGRELMQASKQLETVRQSHAQEKKVQLRVEQLLVNLLNVPTLFCLPQTTPQ